LIAYPGKPLASDIYQWRKSILPRKESANQYSGAQYNLEARHLVVFAEEDQIRPKQSR